MACSLVNRRLVSSRAAVATRATRKCLYKAPFTHAFFGVIFSYDFAIQNAPYPSQQGCFFAKHRLDWKENDVEETPLSNLSELCGVLGQCFRIKKTVTWRWKG